MNERIKAALSAKIDSREKFDQFLRDHGFASAIATDSYNLTCLRAGSCFPEANDVMRFSPTNALPRTHWWWAREMMRVAFGVYPPIADSTVISNCYTNSFTMGYVPHVSVKDPSMIAVTMSPDDGARDKQTQIALGKWLRRIYPTMTDATIQQLEATHRADIANELEILRDADSIEQAYTTMEGDTGCMRHTRDYFGLDHHPSVVYASPGFGVAVVRNIKGKVVARSVVYDNPDDPSDKRYIRIYGDPSLKRRLERNGYKCAGFAGTHLNAIPVDGEDDCYILPYLDSPGGYSSGINNKAQVGVVLRGGKFYAVSAQEWADISQALSNRNLDVSEYCRASSTAVKARIKRLPEDLFAYRCEITGETRDSKEHPPVQAWVNGRVVTACPQAVEGFQLARTYPSDGASRPVAVYCDHTTPTFDYRNLTWIEAEANRHACGMVQLDAELYPDDRNWYPTSEVVGVGDRRQRAKARDAVVLQTMQGKEFRLATEVQPDWVRLHKSSYYPGMAVYSLPDAPWGLTASKTKVGLYTHPVVKLYDGSLEFKRNTKNALLPIGDDLFVNVHKETTRAELMEIARTTVKEHIDRWAGALDANPDLLTQRTLALSVRSWVRGYHYPVLRGGSFTWAYVADAQAPLDDVLAAYETYLEQINQAPLHILNQFPRGVSEAIVDVLRYAKAKRDEITQPAEQSAQPESADRFVVAA